MGIPTFSFGLVILIPPAPPTPPPVPCVSRIVNGNDLWEYRFLYDLLYGVHATCSFAVQKKKSAVGWCTEVSLYSAHLVKNHILAQNTVKHFNYIQMQRLDSFWDEQLSLHEHRNKRDSPSTPGQGTPEVTVTASLLANTCWSRGTGPSNRSSVDGSTAKALMGSFFGGERKNFKLTISNILVDELVNSKNDFICMTLKNLCKVRKCNNLKKSYLYIYKL